MKHESCDSRCSRHSYTQNRELSWLRFNERVLMEAADEGVPMLERLKFAAIFTGNLDEFFMIRVGSLFDLVGINKEAVDNKTGMTVVQQLEAVFEAVQPLIRKKDAIYRGLTALLRLGGIFEMKMEELERSDLKFVKSYFKAEIEPVLSPQIVDRHHPFPHLPNKALYVGAMLHGSDGHKEGAAHKKTEACFGLIPLPAMLPEVLFLPGEGIRYLHLSDILLFYTDKIFEGYEISEKALLCVTRNADITPADEVYADAYKADEDFRDKMQQLLKTRKRLSPVRLEIGNEVSKYFLSYFCKKLNIQEKHCYITASPMKMEYVFSLADKLSEEQKEKLLYHPYTPQPASMLIPNERVMKQVQKRDLLLSYPYESMEPFLQLIREAAYDKAVLSIKISIYRLAGRAKIVDYLCRAAENGKEVTVLIELRARFDEQHNINWSQRLEEAGCVILYGFELYKVHSKICLITRKERSGISYITQIGTGNYNEKTAKQYADLALITANRGIGQDAADFFKNMAIGNLEGHYNRLLVAPYTMKNQIMTLMDREIAKGEEGRLLFKLNAVTDLELIKKLREASCAGVRIELIVRGSCCVLPLVENETDHITIRSIVGRYLEHARIYLFGEGDEELMYISSADFMTRNMERRVEVGCPVDDPEIRKRIHRMIELQLADNTKARLMRSDGSYRNAGSGTMTVNSQAALMRDALEAKVPEQQRKSRLFGWLKK